MTVLEIIFTIALTFSAVFSPCFVSYTNNKFQLELNKQTNEQTLKMKRLEYYYNFSSIAISSFLEKTAMYMAQPNEENLLNYKMSYAKAFMYLPKKSRHYADFLNSDIIENHQNELQHDFDNLLASLGENSND